MKSTIQRKRALVATLGSAAFLAGGVASAGSLFQADDLGSGYAVDDQTVLLAEGKCGEGRCGGGDKDKGGEGKCGGDGDKDAEGKCGEGRCGG